MNNQNINPKYQNGNGEILFILFIIIIVYFINQFTKKEHIVEEITNQLDINLQHKTFKLNYSDKGIVYYASIEDGKINIQKNLITDLINKYCLNKISESSTKGWQDHVIVHNIDPFIVECNSKPNKKLLRRLVSDSWTYSLSSFNRVVGKGDGYLILLDKKIIEIKTGKVKSDNTLYNYYNRRNK